MVLWACWWRLLAWNASKQSRPVCHLQLMWWALQMRKVCGIRAPISAAARWQVTSILVILNSGMKLPAKAIQNFGGNPRRLDTAKLNPKQLLGYVEVHI